MKDLIISFVFLVVVGGAFLVLMKELSATRSSVHSILVGK